MESLTLALFSFYLPKSSSTWSALTEEEKVLVVSRLEEEGGLQERHLGLADLTASNREQAFSALKDWKVWIYMIMFFCGSVPNTSVSK